MIESDLFTPHLTHAECSRAPDYIIDGCGCPMQTIRAPFNLSPPFEPCVLVKRARRRRKFIQYI